MARTWTISAWIGLGLLAVWLWFPALFAVHVEGFSASIEAIARHMNGGDLANFDAAYPYNTEFFGLSRLGMNLLTAGLTQAFGGASGLALTTLMLVSFVALTAASLSLARRWTGAPVLAVALALVLIKGLGESAFFFNDNVTSAALAVGALALLARNSSFGMVVLAGVLLAGAVLTRSDAILIAPAFALVLIEREGWTRALVLKGLVGGLVFAALFVGVLALWGVSPFDLARVVSYTNVLWHRDFAGLVSLREGLFFIGLPALGLGAIGLSREFTRHQWMRLAMQFGVPAIFLLIYWGKLYQARQFMLLTPFIAALAAEGIMRLRQLQTERSPLGLMLAAGCVAVLLWPGYVVYSDGPRAFVGRVWSPLLWRDWQGGVAANFDRLDRLVANAGGPQTIIISDNWDADRYLHLTLQKAGYGIDRTGLPAACGSNVEPFRRDDKTIFHVRLHLPMMQEAIAALPALYDADAAPCIAALPQAGLAYVALSSEMARQLDDKLPAPALAAPGWPLRPDYETLTPVTFDRDRLPILRAAYERWAVAAAATPPLSPDAVTALAGKLGPQTGLLTGR